MTFEADLICANGRVLAKRNSQGLGGLDVKSDGTFSTDPYGGYGNEKWLSTLGIASCYPSKIP